MGSVQKSNSVSMDCLDLFHTIVINILQNFKRIVPFSICSPTTNYQLYLLLNSTIMDYPYHLFANKFEVFQSEVDQMFYYTNRRQYLSARKHVLNNIFDKNVKGIYFTKLKKQVGEFREITEPICAFVRLKDAVTFSNLTEVPVPTRFIFLYLGPPVKLKLYLLTQQVVYFLFVLKT